MVPQIFSSHDHPPRESTPTLSTDPGSSPKSLDFREGSFSDDEFLEFKKRAAGQASATEGTGENKGPTSPMLQPDPQSPQPLTGTQPPSQNSQSAFLQAYQIRFQQQTTSPGPSSTQPPTGTQPPSQNSQTSSLLAHQTGFQQQTTPPGSLSTQPLTGTQPPSRDSQSSFLQAYSARFRQETTSPTRDLSPNPSPSPSPSPSRPSPRPSPNPSPDPPPLLESVPSENNSEEDKEPQRLLRSNATTTGPFTPFKVFALYQGDSCFWSGTVTDHVGHNHFRIEYDDGDTGQVTVAGLRRHDLRIGDLVVAVEGGSGVVRTIAKDSPGGVLVEVELDVPFREGDQTIMHLSLDQFKITKRMINSSWGDRKVDNSMFEVV